MNYRVLWGAVVLAGTVTVVNTALALEAVTSGQVNRAIMYVDDGQDSESFFVDNENSNTRFRFVGSENITETLTGGLLFEVGLVSNGSSAVSMENRDTDFKLQERHMDLFTEGRLGKVSLGQGSGAADGIMEMDLSGTTLVNYSSTTDIGASFTFQEDGVAGPKIGDTAANFDFGGRYDRVRYDTPKFGIATFAVGVGTKGGNDTGEIAARFTSDLGGGGKIAAGIGYSSEDVGGAEGTEENTGGSISWLAANGINLTAAVANNKNDTDLDAKFSYFKIGYMFGMHALAVDFALNKDLDQEGDESGMAGIGYVTKPIDWAEFYLAAKVHSLERDGANFDNINIVTGGARFKF